MMYLLKKKFLILGLLQTFPFTMTSECAHICTNPRLSRTMGLADVFHTMLEFGEHIE
jgi:hypothetical protein